MKTLSEFFYEENKSDFSSEEDAKIYLKHLFNDILKNDIHYGDCVKQNVSCLMCELTFLLENYYKSIKKI